MTSLITVVKKIGGQKRLLIKFTTEPDDFTVARILGRKTGEIVGFISMSDKGKEYVSIDPNIYDLEPIFPISPERGAIIISGQAGQGKSVLGALFLDQYEKLFPENPMYLISEKLKDVDQNLSQIENLTQLSPEEIHSFDINDYSNCIFLVDDSDYGKSAKDVFNVLNLISTVGREYGISYIFITHFNSRLNATSVFKEFQIYITYQDNLANNRMLETHMGMDKKLITDLKEKNSSFYLFNRLFNILITDSGVEKIR